MNPLKGRVGAFDEEGFDLNNYLQSDPEIPNAESQERLLRE